MNIDLWGYNMPMPRTEQQQPFDIGQIRKKEKRIRREYNRVATPLLASAENILLRISSLNEFKDNTGFIVGFKHKDYPPISTVQIGQVNDADDFGIENDLVTSILREQNKELGDHLNPRNTAVITIGNVIVGLNGFDKGPNGALLMGIAFHAGLVGDYDESIKNARNLVGLDATALYVEYIHRFRQNA